ncbi:MAG: hypothetical protein AAFY98_10585 [Verrucomicrobiota bacterium]
MHRFIPEPGQVIELHDDSGNVKAITWVEDTLGYSMNGCFKVRDKAGKVRLITKSRQSRIVPRWRAV